jgi:hypothetical protein
MPQIQDVMGKVVVYYYEPLTGSCVHKSRRSGHYRLSSRVNKIEKISAVITQ